MSQTSRREFLRVAAVVGGGLAVPGVVSRAWARAGDPPSFYTVKKLVEGAIRVTALIGDGGNSLVAGDGSGGWAVVIDTKNAPLGAMLRRADALAAGADFSKGERLVINTHHHGDHTGGNWAFDGVPIVAHANARPRVLAQTKNYLGSIARVVKSLESDETAAGKAALPFAKEYLEKCESFKPEAWAPTKTISGEKNTIKVGALAIEAYHYGPGHTDNDIVLRLPEQNIVHMGDLLFHKNWCVIDRSAGANTENWMKSVSEVIKLCDGKTVVIPGHGELTDVEGLKGQVAFLERVRAVVGEAIKAGKSKEEVLKMEPAEFAERGMKQMRERTLGAVYDELAKAE